MSIINKTFGVNYIKYVKNGFNRVPNIKNHKKFLPNMKFMWKRIFFHEYDAKVGNYFRHLSIETS